MSEYTQEQGQEHASDCECESCKLAERAADALEQLIGSCLMYKGQHMMGAPDFITLLTLDRVTASAISYANMVREMVNYRDEHDDAALRDEHDDAEAETRAAHAAGALDDGYEED